MIEPIKLMIIISSHLIIIKVEGGSGSFLKMLKNSGRKGDLCGTSTLRAGSLIKVSVKIQMHDD